MPTINTAVILAAGMGNRLKEVHSDAPKGFLRLGDKPIIVESIEKIKAVGINNIFIVTGYCDEYYEGLKDVYPQIKTIRNAEYAITGSMYSLACLKDLISEDFILLESDLIYEQRALDLLIKEPKADCLLLSGWTNSGDEVYVGVIEEKVRHLSKVRSEVSDALGEFVGISRISLSLFKTMMVDSNMLLALNKKVEYDTGCLSHVAKKYHIGCLKIEDLAWAEVDDPKHLARAKDIIYSKIQESDKVWH